MDELDPDAWDPANDEELGEGLDAEATEYLERVRAKKPPARREPELPAPPSASEMAGDGAVGGDGIDEPGWD